MESWTLVTFPILAGALVLSLNQILKRFIMKSKGISPLQLLVHLYSAVTIFFGLIYLILWGTTVPELLPGFWRAVFLGSAVNFLIQYFSTRATSLDQGEVSLTAPLFAMTPGLITLLAITLGEYPSKIGLAGIFLMALGSYILMFDKTPQHWWEYISPFKKISLLFKINHLPKEEKGKALVVFLSLLSAMLGTFGLLFDGLYVRRGINIQGLTLAMITLMGLLSLGYGIWYILKPDANGEQSRSFGFHFYWEQPKYLLTLTCMMIFWVIMIYTFQPTYAHTYVAYVGTLKRFSILTTVVLGHLIFKEGDVKKRLGSAILIILGAILISMDDLPSRITSQMEILGL